ncbi:cytochrome P450 [Zopfochytrium polystomum]|nr:cytochrome P450 [Zopfochytrium polystomum]
MTSKQQPAVTTAVAVVANVAASASTAAVAAAVAAAGLLLAAWRWRRIVRSFLVFSYRQRRLELASAEGTRRIPTFSMWGRIWNHFLHSNRIGNEWLREEGFLRQLRREKIIKYYNMRRDCWTIYLCGAENAKLYAKVIEKKNPKTPPVPGDPFAVMLKQNIQFSHGEKYARLAKIILPPFRRAASGWNIEELVRQSEIMVDSIERLAMEGLGASPAKKQPAPIHMGSVCSKFFIDCVGSQLFGVDLQIQTNDPYDLWRPLKIMQDHGQPLNARYEAVAAIHTNLYKLVEQRREELLTAGQPLWWDPLDTSNSLSNIVRAVNDGELSEEEAKHNLAELFLAGHANACLILCIALRYLSLHVDSQHKAHEAAAELQQQPLSTASRTFVDCVAMEAARLFSNGTFPWPSELVEDLASDDGRWLLPQGCVVRFSLDGHHRDPEVWGPDAAAWRPERFLPALTTPSTNAGGAARAALRPIPTMGWVPFGVGARACPGSQLGMLMLRVCLTAIVRNYHVSMETSRVPWTLEEIHFEHMLFRLEKR